MAQFNVQLKDGSEYLVDAPDDATQFDLLRLINRRSRTSEEYFKKQFDSALDAKQVGIDSLLQSRRAREEEDESVVSNLIEGFGAGFVGIGESAALGAAALLEEEDELAARDWIQENFETDDEGDEDSISYGLGQAFGSIAGIAAPAALAAFIPGTAAAAATGTGIAALVGSGAMAGQSSERARAAGATEEERNKATFRGALIGTLDAVPVARFLKVVNIPVISKLIDKLGPETVRGIGNKIWNSGLSGITEAVQEVTSEILMNVNEQQYNALAETFEGIGPAAGYGGGAGAIIQGLIDIFVPGTSRKGDATPTTDEQTVEEYLALPSPETFDELYPPPPERLPAPEKQLALPPPQERLPAPQGKLPAPTIGETDARGRFTPTDESIQVRGRMGRSSKFVDTNVEKDEARVGVVTDREEAEVVSGDMPSEDVRGQRELSDFERAQEEARDRLDPERRDDDMFAAELEREQERLDATPTTDVEQETIKITKGTLDKLNIPQSKLTPIRKKLTGQTIPVEEFKQRILDYAKLSKAPLKAKDAITRYLENDRKDAPAEQLSLFPAKQQTKKLKASIKPKKDDSSFSGTVPLKHGSSESDLTGFIDSKDVDPEARYKEAGAFGDSSLYMDYEGGSFVSEEQTTQMMDYPAPPYVYDVDAKFEKAFVLTPDTVGELRKVVGGDSTPTAAYAGTRGENVVEKLKEEGYDGLIVKDMEQLEAGLPTIEEREGMSEAERFQVQIEEATRRQGFHGEIFTANQVVSFNPTKNKIVGKPNQQRGVSRIEETATEVTPDVAETTTATLTEAPTHIQRKLAKTKEEKTPDKQVTQKDTTAKRVTTEETTKTKQRTGNITAKPKPKAKSKAQPKKLTVKQQAEATLQLMQKYKAEKLAKMKVAEDQNIIQLRDDGYFDPKYLGFETVQDGGFRITFLMDGIPSDATGTSPLTQGDTAKIDEIKNEEKVTEGSPMESLQGFFGSRTNPKVEPLSALYWAIFEDVFHARKYTEGKKKGKFVYPQQYNSTGESDATKKFFKATGRRRARKVLEWADENMSPKTKQWMENVRRELQAEEAKTELSLVASDKADLRRQKASEQDKSIAAAEKIPKIKRTDRSNRKLRQDLSNFNTIRTATKGEAINVTEQYTFAQNLTATLDKIFKGFALTNEAVSALSERLHPITTALVADGNLKEALEAIGNTSGDRDVRNIARKLSRLTGTTKIEFDSDLSTAGRFDPKTNTVYINPISGANTHVIFHEVTHALTSATLANKNHPLTIRLNNLFNEVKDSLDTAYGATTLDEFAAEAFSNPDFQQQLSNILLKNGKESTGTNALTRFYNFVAKFINNKLGLNFKTYSDTLTESNKIILEILSPAPDSRNARALLMDDSPKRVKALGNELGKIAKSFSPMTQEGRKEFGQRVVDFLQTKIPQNVAGFLLSVLPSQPLADVSSAFGVKGMQDLHVVMEEQRGDLSKVDNKMDAAVIKVRQWLNKQSDSVKELFDDVVYTSTIEQVDPSKPKSSYVVAEEIALDKEARRIVNNVFKKTKQEISLEEARKQIPQEKLDSIKAQADLDDAAKLAEWDKLNRKYKKLGKGGQDTYKFMRDVYKDIYSQLKDVMGGRLDDLPLPEDAKKKLKKEVFDRLFELGEIDPYFPLTRSGDYWLSYTLEGENVVESFESPTVRRHVAEALTKEAGVDGSSIQEFVNIKNFDFTKTPATSFINQTLRTLQSNGVSTEVMEEVTRLFLNALPESSFAKSLKNRKKVPGYIENSLDAMQIKGYDLARQVARLRSTEKINGLMDDIEEGVKGTKLGTTVIGKIFLEEIRKRADFARNPPKDGIAQVLNRGAFMFTIGFNASSALVNLSQIPLFVAPMFGAKYGYENTTQALGQAMRLGAASIGKGRKINLPTAFGDSEILTVDRDRAMPAIDNYYVYDADNNYVIRKDIDIPDNLRKELEELSPLVRMASERGQLNRSLIADSMGIDTSGRDKSVWDKISSVSAFMFHQAEQINRQTTMIAAYKLELQQINEKAKDSKNPESKMSTAEKQQLASTNALYATQEVNGGSVLETGPRVSQQGFMRVSMMYKNFGIQMYYSMWKAALPMLNTNFTKEERVVAVKQILGVHGTALAMAGVSGIPIFGPIAWMANLLFDFDDDEEGEVTFETMVRDYVTEEWYKGGITTLFDIDVSQRIALTNLLFTANRYDRDPSTADTIALFIGGPAYSVFKRGSEQGYKDLSEGEIIRGIENMVPSAVRNLIKGGYRYTRDDGIYSRRGDPIMENYGVGDAAAVVLGFPPLEYTRKTEYNSIRKNIDTAVAKKRTKLTKKLYIALRFGDLEGAREVKEEIKKFNRKFPSNSISGKTINKSLKGHMKTSFKMYNGVLLNKNMRRSLLEIRPRSLDLWED